MLKRTIAMLTMGLAALAFATPAQADKPKIGAQGAFVLPVGDLGEVSGVGVGALINVDYGISAVKGLQLTGRLGVVHYLGKEIEVLGTTIDGPSVTTIPILVGVKYFFAPGVYGGLEFGGAYAMPEQLDGAPEPENEFNLQSTLGLGYMMKDLDIRAFMYFTDMSPEGKNTDGDDAGLMDRLGIGLTVGYRFWAP